jgi:hypothetical protein
VLLPVAVLGDLVWWALEGDAAGVGPERVERGVLTGERVGIVGVGSVGGRAGVVVAEVEVGADEVAPEPSSPVVESVGGLGSVGGVGLVEDVADVAGPGDVVGARSEEINDVLPSELSELGAALDIPGDVAEVEVTGGVGEAIEGDGEAAEGVPEAISGVGEGVIAAAGGVGKIATRAVPGPRGVGCVLVRRELLGDGVVLLHGVLRVAAADTATASMMGGSPAAARAAAPVFGWYGSKGPGPIAP